MKLLYGVGINDSGGVSTTNGRCEIYTKWKNMLSRCYSKATQKRQPTYVGCIVDDRWLTFSTFKEWIKSQPDGFLDKDILVEGNKVYGPDTCVVVDRETNMFFTGSNRDIPRGVYQVGDKWRVKTYYGKPKSHGTFRTIEEAQAVHEKYRYEMALSLANKQTDSRVSEILKTRFSPKF